MAFNFGVDVLPTTTETLSLGDNSHKWIIYGTLNGNASSATNATNSTNAATATKATQANITTNANAIAYYTDANGTFGAITGGKGALYAANASSTAAFGTLPVDCGGTGATTFTQGAALIGNGTGAITTRGITNNTSATALSESTNLATVNTVKNALANINGSAQIGGVTIYAPTTVGTSGYFLKSSGTGAPTWADLNCSASFSAGSANAPTLTINLFGTGYTTTNGIPLATNTNVGVVKLSDTVNSTQGVTSNTAATPKCVLDAINNSTVKLGTQTVYPGKDNSGDTFDINTLIEDLGFSKAFRYRGVKTTLPTSPYTGYTSGDVIVVSGTTSTTNDGIWAFNGTAWEKLGTSTGYKIIQDAVSDPSVSNNATSTTFISNITQNSNGVINATKKGLPAASSSVAGVTTLGASGGAATFEHTHNNYLPLLGGELNGMLKITGMKGTENVDYGSTLPATGTTGQIFYQLTSSALSYELPAGGTTGQVLVKQSNSDRDVDWEEVSGIPSGGAAGEALIKNSATDGDVTWGAVGGIMTPVSSTSTTFYVTGSTATTENSDPAVFSTSVYITNNVLHGAAWNDYAEYRSTDEIIEAGRCIIENGDGTLALSTKRMQGGAEIVSDTFGFAIGETDKCRTPIAVSGRVLAYGDKPANEFSIGAPVCSGENGTISEMTEDEARNYPWLIIGTVSAIPQEEYWGTQQVPTKGRIWIRIR